MSQTGVVGITSAVRRPRHTSLSQSSFGFALSMTQTFCYPMRTPPPPTSGYWPETEVIGITRVLRAEGCRKAALLKSCWARGAIIKSLLAREASPSRSGPGLVKRHTRARYAPPPGRGHPGLRVHTLWVRRFRNPSPEEGRELKPHRLP